MTTKHLLFLCVLLTQCSKEDSNPESNNDSKAVFEETQSQHKKSSLKLVSDIENLKKVSASFVEREATQPKETLNFKFAKVASSSIISDSKVNSIIVRTLKDGLIDEMPRNGFSVYSTIQKGTTDLEKTFEEVYKTPNRFSQSRTKMMLDLLSHYPENLKYVFVLFETENLYPKLIGGGKYSPGKYKAKLLLYKVGELEPIGIQEVSYDLPKTIQPRVTGAKWSVNSVHTESVLKGVSKAISSIGTLEGEVPKYQSYSSQIIN